MEKYNLNHQWLNYIDNPQEIVDAAETYEFFQSRNPYLLNSAQRPEDRLYWACHTKLFVKYFIKFARGMVSPRVDEWSDNDLEEYYVDGALGVAGFQRHQLDKTVLVLHLPINQDRSVDYIDI